MVRKFVKRSKKEPTEALAKLFLYTTDFPLGSAITTKLTRRDMWSEALNI